MRRGLLGEIQRALENKALAFTWVPLELLGKREAGTRARGGLKLLLAGGCVGTGGGSGAEVYRARTACINSSVSEVRRVSW